MLRSFLHLVFSSRRRHTISLCDWSSDVCSSDLFSQSQRNSVWTVPGTQQRTNRSESAIGRIAEIETDPEGRSYRRRYRRSGGQLDWHPGFKAAGEPARKAGTHGGTFRATRDRSTRGDQGGFKCRAARPGWSAGRKPADWVLYLPLADRRRENRA